MLFTEQVNVKRAVIDLFLCGGLVSEDFQEEPQDWTPYGTTVGPKWLVRDDWN